MSIKDVLADFEDEDFIPPRTIYTKHTSIGNGTSIYYYIYGKDSQGYHAALKLDQFENKVRFTNFKKVYPINEYKPYFDKFMSGWSCSYDEIKQLFESSSSVTVKQLNIMAKHWGVSVEQFINTLLLAFELLFDAEENNWLGSSMWEGG